MLLFLFPTILPKTEYQLPIVYQENQASFFPDLEFLFLSIIHSEKLQFRYTIRYKIQLSFLFRYLLFLAQNICSVN